MFLDPVLTSLAVEVLVGQCTPDQIQNLLSRSRGEKTDYPQSINCKNSRKVFILPCDYSYGTRTSTCICFSYGSLTKLIRVKHWLETVSSYLGLRLWLYEWKSNSNYHRVVRGRVVRLRIIECRLFPIEFFFLKIERRLKRLAIPWQFNNKTFQET